jgi:membrane protease YdiL (CAAX protease family)
MEPTNQPATPRKPYPRISQSLILLLICIGFTVLFSILQSVLVGYISIQASFLIMYILIFGCTLWVGWRLKRQHEPHFHFSLSNIPWAAYPILYIVTISIATLSLPLTELIPMPEEIQQLFENLMGDDNIFMFLAAVIAAPLFEEFIFRGIILNGLLRHYSPTFAILFSSFLFGIAHLNPWQFIIAFLLGSFIGWVYYRTRSLLPCIAIHFFANGSSYLSSNIWDMDANTTALSLFGGATNLAIGMVVALALVALGIYGLHRLLKKAPVWHTTTETTN